MSLKSKGEIFWNSSKDLLRFYPSTLVSSVSNCGCWVNFGIDYLTEPVDADIGTVLRAQSAVLHLAGQGEEEVVAFREAVQLAHILIWKEAKQTQRQSVYAHLGAARFLRFSSLSSSGCANSSYRPLWCTASRCSTILGTAGCWTLRTAVPCSRECCWDSPRCCTACTTWTSPRRTSLRMLACRVETGLRITCAVSEQIKRG